jgi:hypothetical protein
MEVSEARAAASFGHAWTLEKDIEVYSRINDPVYTTADDPDWRRFMRIVRREQAGSGA